MCSAFRWEADTSSRDYWNFHHLRLRYLIYVSQTLLQMLAHSRYHSKWLSADLLQEAFYSEPPLSDSSCWIGMTVSSARSYTDLFQKRKTKTNIDANFGRTFNCYISKAALHHIQKETAMISTTTLLPLSSFLHTYMCFWKSPIENRGMGRGTLAALILMLTTSSLLH